MFIERLQHPTIEFDPDAGQESPTLVHYFSDRADPFKTVLPVLIEGTGQDQERVFVVTSPLSQIIDETLRLHQHPDFIGQLVVDENRRPFFEAIKLALTQAIEKIEQVQFVTLDDEEEDQLF